MLKRILFGAIYVAVLCFSVWLGSESFTYLMLTFCGLCLYEYGRMVDLNFTLIAGLIVLSLVILLTHSKVKFILSDGGIGFFKVPYLIFLASLIWVTFSQEKTFKTIGAFLFGILYITVPFYLSLDFIYNRNNFIWIFVFFMVNDSFAYLIGRKWGKRKLAPNISPKKTIEGLIGGIIFSLILGLVLEYTKQPASFNWIIIALLASVLGTTGDLIESKLKREAKIKDTGNLIPGHGGFLDRLDSFIFAMPFIYMYIYL